MNLFLTPVLKTQTLRLLDPIFGSSIFLFECYLRFILSMLKCTWHLKPDNSGCWWHRMVSLLHKQQKHRLVSMSNCFWNRDDDEKENTGPFLYATEEPLIKEHLHFILSSPEKTIHLERIMGKQISQKEMRFHCRTHLPKMTMLGCFTFWCLKRIKFVFFNLSVLIIL